MTKTRLLWVAVRGFAAVWGLLACLTLTMVATAVPAAAARDSLQDFEALLRPNPHIVADVGKLGVPVSQAINLDWQTSGVTEGASDGLVNVEVMEWRWPSLVPATDDDSPPPDTPLSQTRRQLDVASPRFTAMDPVWSLEAQPGHAAPGFANVKSCQISISKDSLVVPQSLQLVEPRLDIQCSAGFLDLKGEGLQVVLKSGSLAVAGLDPDRLEESHHAWIAGAFAKQERAASDGIVYHNLLRHVILTFQGAGEPFAGTSAQEIRLKASVVHWTGRVSLPAYEGTVRIGNQVLNSNGTEQDFQGSFMMRAKEHPLALTQVEILGMAADGATTSDLRGPGPTASVILGATAGLLVVMELLRRLANIFLFSRVSADEALRHPIRRSLMDLVRNDPGVRAHEARKVLGIHSAAVRHHLKILEKSRLVDVVRRGRRVHLYPHDSAARNAEALALLRETHVQRIMRLIRLKNEQTQKQLAVRAGLSQPSLSQLLQRMERSGIISRERRRRGTRYTILL